MKKVIMMLSLAVFSLFNMIIWCHLSLKVEVQPFLILGPRS